MVTMKLKLDKIRPNPFRDFDLYPYDPEQIQRLQQSMDDIEFYPGVTARKADGGYELAAGHHRLKAAQRAGFTEVEAVVEPYTDRQMVEIMAAENLLQRGHNAASTLNSVAAFCKIVIKEVLLGDGSSSKFLEDAGPEYLPREQGRIAKNGPGMELLYRAMNSFSKKERATNKKAEKITSTDIDQALSSLKSGGKMASIVQSVYAEVEEIYAQRAEIERVKREKEEQAAIALEKKRRDEEERQQADLEKRRKAEEEAEWNRQQAEERNTKNKAAAKAEAEKRKQEREEAEAALAEQRKADKAARDAEVAAKKERAKADKEEADRQAKEREAIKAQKALAAIYDLDCVHVFRLTSHEKVFRENVLSENGRRFIPKNQQLPLAQHIRKQIDETETKQGHDLGSVTISSMLQTELAKLIGIQRDIDKREKDELLRANAQMRVEKLWVGMRRAVAQAESALAKLVEEQSKWAYDVALFPMYEDDINRVISAGRRMEKLKKALGY